jgi:hypothetical protein
MEPLNGMTVPVVYLRALDGCPTASDVRERFGKNGSGLTAALFRKLPAETEENHEHNQANIPA